MCGRFTLGADTDKLVAEFGLGWSDADPGPRYNIAPTQNVAAVVRGADGLRLGVLRWGLIPYGAKDPGVGNRMINARSETVDRKAAFRFPFQKRRCWILADGFYEWRRDPDGGKTPIHVRLPGARPFAFAGLWDRWTDAAGTPIHSCTILTTSPSDALRPIHDRMPVILPAAARDAWLDPAADPATLKALLVPYQGPVETFEVSTRVNSPAHDDPACVAPIGPPQTTT